MNGGCKDVLASVLISTIKSSSRRIYSVKNESFIALVSETKDFAGTSYPFLITNIKRALAMLEATLV